ncbi:unnamed protein product [Ilex paraguariensis]|uniref:Uncharacterized protein n=1 Tax=Ilex paraguariensis TaxID=185542 RepID=A0ABC8QZL6_9AQUA
MNSPTIDCIQNYEPMLKESINQFLTSYRNGMSDFSDFESISCRFFQATADPTLEIIWFYSAVVCHRSKSSTLTLQEPSKKILLANDLFQFVLSCSTPCDGLKKVAVLAPVVYELHNLLCEFSKKDLCLKTGIEGLIERIVSYISLWCGNDTKDQEKGSDNSMVRFQDLVRVWTVDRIGENCRFGDVLKVFFPLLSDEVCNGLIKNCKIGYLAGIVMNEVFLLSLYLKFDLGGSTEELQKDLKDWAGQTINGFQNYYFLDTLLRMQLEPSFPVTTLLSLRDAVLLRKMLFDTVILVDYAFINTGRWTQLPGNHLKDLALLWLLVVDSAIQLARVNHEQSRVISYENAFSESILPTQLIHWVTTQTCMDEKTRRPNISTPETLINV